MAAMYAYCGLDCAECGAYKATQANDEKMMNIVLAQWRKEFNAPDMPLTVVICDGCTSSGRMGGYCNECPVRACGVSKGVVNCAYCDEYESCTTLQDLIKGIPSARENLALIRAGL